RPSRLRRVSPRRRTRRCAAPRCAGRPRESSAVRWARRVHPGCRSWSAHCPRVPRARQDRRLAEKKHGKHKRRLKNEVISTLLHVLVFFCAFCAFLRPIFFRFSGKVTSAPFAPFTRRNTNGRPHSSQQAPRVGRAAIALREHEEHAPARAVREG